ncbi:hypothetical protein C5L31_000813 [Secundilactobacillus malefermentans]|uniref:HAD superfamily hydrolase n=1 Tax=Secundilactobacillus malefermentans TaxID=176292 RepID=A0A4R5NLV2_9LACO|nr:HAD superfamily hydrolase [Secundilactobacillus malefermentans DSM 5705 = KCTC 3548]TDG76200.1 hypothetical protein C5L31_000813 [Secundilactobacillus malefermentans]
MIDRKLVTIDLDGTTLNNQSKLSTKTKKVIKAASKAGHIVSIVTGRPNRLSTPIYDALELESPMINFNGSLGFNPHQKWSEEYQFTINRDIVLDLLKNYQRFDINLIAAEGKNLFLAQQQQPTELNFFPSVLQANEELNSRSLSQDPTSLTIQASENKLQSLSIYIEEKYGLMVDVNAWGGPHNVIEVGHKGIQKATGVEKIAHYFQIKRQNIIAFGDESNDNAMIDYAGWGVAMNNANSHLKSIANDVTRLDNENDGLADYLSDYLQLDAANF